MGIKTDFGLESTMQDYLVNHNEWFGKVLSCMVGEDLEFCGKEVVLEQTRYGGGRRADMVFRALKSNLVVIVELKLHAKRRDWWQLEGYLELAKKEIKRQKASARVKGVLVSPDYTSGVIDQMEELEDMFFWDMTNNGYWESEVQNG